MRETLEVCACYRPDLGYVQGMSYYAAVLCLHIDDPMLVFQCFANLIVKEHVFEFFKAESETLSRCVVAGGARHPLSFPCISLLPSWPR